MRHGHAISIDMAYSATLANLRGILSDEDYKRHLNLFSKAGLSMDHKDFTEEVLDQGTKAILKTRDGLLRAAVPSPLGSCVFLNDVSTDEMNAALKKHKEMMKNYPRNGEGIEAFVDASDTGYTMNGIAAEYTNGKANGQSNGHTNGASSSVINDDAKNGTNGVDKANGVKTSGQKAATNHASGPEGVDGMQNGVQNTIATNGH